jgi:hypothetical protein
MRAAGWRLLVSRAGVWRSEGFAYALDNGAWTDFQAGSPFDGDTFDRLIEKMGSCADWIVLPDIVAGGIKSLELSLRWMNRCRSVSDLVLLAVQDGMEPADVRNLLGRHVGVFLGGSTEWKIERMRDWGALCADVGCHYHVARVNTRGRMRLAVEAGASSVDGSSASRFAKNVGKITNWASQPSFLSPRKAA